MKIALCFSGQIRTGVLTSKNILNFIGDMIDECDVFVHTWDSITQTSSDLSIAGIPSKESNFLFEQFSDIWHPKKMIVENYKEWINKNIRIEPLFYSIMECNKFKKETGNYYDFTIKIRPDFIYNPSYKLRDELELILKSDYENTIYTLDFSNSIIRNKFEDVFWIAKTDIFDTVVNYYFERLLNNESDWQIEMAKFLTKNNIMYKGLFSGNHGAPYRWYNLNEENRNIEDYENDWLGIKNFL
jgi:hypothetical protein